MSMQLAVYPQGWFLLGWLLVQCVLGLDGWGIVALVVLLMLQRGEGLLRRILRVVVVLLLPLEDLEGSRGAVGRKCTSSLFLLRRGQVCCVYWWRSVLRCLGQGCTKRLRVPRL